MGLMARLGGRGNRKIPFSLFDGKDPADLSSLLTSHAHVGDRLAVGLSKSDNGHEGVVDWATASIDESSGDSISRDGTNVVINEDGLYAFAFKAAFASPGSAGHVGLRVYDGLSPAWDESLMVPPESAASPQVVSVGGVWWFPATDIIDCFVLHGNATPLTVFRQLFVVRLA